MLRVGKRIKKNRRKVYISSAAASAFAVGVATKACLCRTVFLLCVCGSKTTRELRAKNIDLLHSTYTSLRRGGAGVGSDSTHKREKTNDIAVDFYLRKS